MNNIMVPVDGLRMGFVVIPFIVLYVLTIFFKNQVVKFFFFLLKTFVYFGLAWFMWKYYKTMENIDIMSAFTFIFCCFESADNFISCISIPIEKVREMIELKNKFYH